MSVLSHANNRMACEEVLLFLHTRSEKDETDYHVVMQCFEKNIRSGDGEVLFNFLDS